MTVRVIFSQGADDPLAVLPEQNNFLLKDKGYFVFWAKIDVWPVMIFISESLRTTACLSLGHTKEQ